MFGALLLFEDEFIHVVSISFTALILTELIMVALTIRTWHWLMIVAEFLSLAIYILSLVILKDFFGGFYYTLMKMSSILIESMFTFQTLNLFEQQISCGKQLQSQPSLVSHFTFGNF